MIRLLHCSSWSMVSWPVATIIRFMRKLLWRRIPAANALTNEFGSSRKHCTAWMRLAEKNVKKMFVNLKQGHGWRCAYKQQASIQYASMH